ncbi:uncharacterized protein LOC124159659 [Ischnura elegans]|uniref:uncharacterized protein LOC124159659 n=1 Tax=Ischnura elegans TaxID=197161 RepID=UPI001ED86B39|nr:uncharacterized protein LOC124159659 [Ischnura elegans]
MRIFKYRPSSHSSGEEGLQLYKRAEFPARRGREDHRSIVTFQLGRNFPPSPDECPREESARSSTLRRLKAILLAILSGLAFTYCALTVHVLRRISPSEVLLFRTGVQSLLIAPAAAWSLVRRRRPVAEETSILVGDRCQCVPWRSVLGQGIVMAASLQLLFVAFQRLPLGDASALIFSAPAHVSVLAWILLGEKPNVAKCAAILGIVAGGVLICQTKPPLPLNPPPDSDKEKVVVEKEGVADSLDATGLAAAIVGTLGYSLHYVLIRRLKNVHYSLTTLSLSIQTFLLSAVILLSSETFQIPTERYEWTLLSTVGLAGTAAHVLLAIALSMEEAAIVASTRSLDIAVAYVVQVTVCDESPTSIGIGGAALISICVFFIAVEPYVCPKLCNGMSYIMDKIRRLCDRNYQ